MQPLTWEIQTTHFPTISHLEHSQPQRTSSQSVELSVMIQRSLLYELTKLSYVRDYTRHHVATTMHDWRHHRWALVAVFCAHVSLSASPYAMINCLATSDFVEFLAKINRQHYWVVLLTQELLPMICNAALLRRGRVPRRAGDLLLCHDTPCLLGLTCGQPTFLT